MDGGGKVFAPRQTEYVADLQQQLNYVARRACGFETSVCIL